MKRIALVFLVLLVPLWVAGCGGQTNDAPPIEIEGAAFVMFYTDN